MTLVLVTVCAAAGCCSPNGWRMLAWYRLIFFNVIPATESSIQETQALDGEMAVLQQNRILIVDGFGPWRAWVRLLLETLPRMEDHR